MGGGGGGGRGVCLGCGVQGWVGDGGHRGVGTGGDNRVGGARGDRVVGEGVGDAGLGWGDSVGMGGRGGARGTHSRSHQASRCPSCSSSRLWHSKSLLPHRPSVISSRRTSLQRARRTARGPGKPGQSAADPRGRPKARLCQAGMLVALWWGTRPPGTSAVGTTGRTKLRGQWSGWQGRP